MKTLLTVRLFKQYNWSIKGKDWESYNQKFKKRIKMIAAIISNGTYFISISNWNTTSGVFEEFLNNLKKYLASKKYFTNWRFSIILDNATYYKTKQIDKKLEEITANVWFLPAYTPQFQPVEIFFGIVKCKLRELKLNNVI